MLYYYWLRLPCTFAAARGCRSYDTSDGLDLAAECRLAHCFARVNFPQYPCCKIRTITRRLSAWPSVVVSGATCRLVPIAPGARMLVNGTCPCCSMKSVT